MPSTTESLSGGGHWLVFLLQYKAADCSVNTLGNLTKASALIFFQTVINVTENALDARKLVDIVLSLFFVLFFCCRMKQ